MRVLYINPVNGIAGDMLTASLLDLGVDHDAFMTALKSLALPADEWSVSIDSVLKRGITSTKFNVNTRETSDGHGRHLGPILAMIEDSGMSARAKSLAKAAFTELAQAEAEVHGTTPEKVHFHEVGAVDSIIDICGACIALDLLSIDRVLAAPPALGGGTVTCDHGTLPVPVPAVCKLLTGLPSKLGPVDCELTTPTGAVLLKVFADSFIEHPAGTMVATGYGAGTKDFESHANVVQTMIFETVDAASADDVIVIEATIDDMPGEYMSHLGPELLDEGALDYCVIPCTMKKSRPGIILQVLCPPDLEDHIATLILQHTTSFGVRRHRCQRTILDREIIQVEPDFGSLSVKIGRDPATGDIIQISPEYDDCHQAAIESGVPLKVVYAAARKAVIPD